VDLEKLPPKARRPFATKIQLAVKLTLWAASLVDRAGIAVWVAVDGGYSKSTFLKPLRKAGITVVGRLRYDAALWSLPGPNDHKRRKYGKHRLSLAKRAAHPKGWNTLQAHLYGKTRCLTYKSFLATYKVAGGMIRAVIVQAEVGSLAFFSTDPTTSPQAILEAAADRAALEQFFHDAKEVHKAGQQQLRNVDANVGAFNLLLWLHTLLELWAWDKPHAQLCDRRRSPWDNPRRRPSHADRRRALRRTLLAENLGALSSGKHKPSKIAKLLAVLGELAA
jgi:hypothetical protein